MSSCPSSCKVTDCLFIQPGLNLEEHLLGKEADMKRLGLNLQPHVVVIAADFEKIDLLMELLYLP
jgi:hypothetical protein